MNTYARKICEHNLYWVGPRESDIEAVKGLFVGSVTFFGNDSPDGYAEGPCRGNHTLDRNKKVDHNNMGDESLDKFVYDTVLDIKEKDPKARFVMYNPNVARPHSKDNGKEQPADKDLRLPTDREGKRYDQECKGRYLFPEKFYEDFYVCLNDDDTMRAMDSKLVFHRLFSRLLGYENMLEIQKLEGKQINSYHELCRVFNVDQFSGVRFIVQEEFASGGRGTHIVAKTKHGEEKKFKDDETYLCSILQENNISVNAHLIIFENDILLLPASVQIIRENDERLMYRGADFISYRQIDERLRTRFEQMCVKIASTYQGEFKSSDDADAKVVGKFRGVLGIDAIIHDGKVSMLECNNRFQASSNLLNYGLRDAELPSLQEMAYHAWCDKAGAANGYSVISSMIRATSPSVLSDEVTDDGIAYHRLNFEVNYSNFNFVDSGSNIIHARRVFELARCYTEKDYNLAAFPSHSVGYASDPSAAKEFAHIYSLERDGYDPKFSYKSFSHLFRISFNTNITSVSPEGYLRLNEDVCEPTKSWSDRIYDNDPAALKIALITLGVAIDMGQETAAALNQNGRYRAATNAAIDLYLHRPITVSAPGYTEMVVNAPIGIRLAPFTPFSLCKVNGENVAHGDEGENGTGRKTRFALYYYQRLINDNVELFPEDDLSSRVTSGGIPYSEVAFLSGDRLRVHLTNFCRFKRQKGQDGKHVGCRFCDMECGSVEYTFSPDTVREVVGAYLERERTEPAFAFDHFLVGGQSPTVDNEGELITLISLLHELAPTKHIYVMTLPMKGSGKMMNILNLIKAGATELSFNMEVFSDDYARKTMPGKARAFSREDYVSTLNAARFVMDDNRKDCVRTMFVVGIEPMNSLMQGLRLMIENGIQPMLSVFRPMPGTELESALPPSMAELYELYLKAESWCEEKGMHLGPACKYCQNNTLSLPY